MFYIFFFRIPPFSFYNSFFWIGIRNCFYTSTSICCIILQLYKGWIRFTLRLKEKMMFYYNNILNKFYFSINLLILRFGPQNIIIILYISYVLCLYIFNIYMLLDFSIYQIFDIYENYTMYINNE